MPEGPDATLAGEYTPFRLRHRYSHLKAQIAVPGGQAGSSTANSSPPNLATASHRRTCAMRRRLATTQRQRCTSGWKPRSSSWSSGVSTGDGPAVVGAPGR